MLIVKKERVINNVLQLYIPKIVEQMPTVSGEFPSSEPEPMIEEVLVGQVYCTINQDNNMTTTKDIWNKSLYSLFTEQIEKEIHEFELSCKEDALNHGIVLEPNRDLEFNKKINTLEQENSVLKQEIEITQDALNEVLFNILATR